MPRLMAALFFVVGVAAPISAMAGEVYCFAEGGDGTTYLTPVFLSDDDPYLLSSMYSKSFQDVGLSICVTEQDESDVSASWQAFLDGLKGQNARVVIQALPSVSF